MKRERLRLNRVVMAPRTNEYVRLRFWWLHELRRLRAKERVYGTSAKSEIRVVQKELVRIRREE